MIYLDYNATTPICKEVGVIGDWFHNWNSLHSWWDGSLFEGTLWQPLFWSFLWKVSFMLKAKFTHHFHVRVFNAVLSKRLCPLLVAKCLACCTALHQRWHSPAEAQRATTLCCRDMCVIVLMPMVIIVLRVLVVVARCCGAAWSTPQCTACSMLWRTHAHSLLALLLHRHLLWVVACCAAGATAWCPLLSWSGCWWHTPTPSSCPSCIPTMKLVLFRTSSDSALLLTLTALRSTLMLLSLSGKFLLT